MYVFLLCNGMRHFVTADGTATIVAGLKLDRCMAQRALQVLSWLCTEPKRIAARVPNTALLVHTDALQHLTHLLDPEPAKASGKLYSLILIRLNSLEQSISPDHQSCSRPARSGHPLCLQADRLMPPSQYSASALIHLESLQVHNV